MKLHRLSVVLFAILLLIWNGAVVHSADEAAAPADPVAEWNQLDAQKLKLAERLEKLKGDFAQADQAGKLKIRQEFQEAITNFQTKIYPRMVELAPKVFELDPKQFEAGELVLETAFRKNRYAEVPKVADQLTAAGHTSPKIPTLTGMSHFALHDFAKARSIFEEAKKADLLNQQGTQYLQAATEYIELWKKEQEIRAAESKATGDEQNPQVELKTSRGPVIVELFENEAPNTVASFISLVESKYYDGTKFHRVIPNFMVQGGDIKSTNDNPADDGTGGPGYTIDCECYREDTRKHFRGSLSMAHSGRNTGGSQFFITHLPTAHLNSEPVPESVHTVFGRVVKGMEIVDAIEKGDAIDAAVVLRKRNHEYKPKTTPDAN